MPFRVWVDRLRPCGLPTISGFCTALLLLLALPSLSHAATVHGKVLDARTHEPLGGARIAIVGTRSGAIAGLNGSYRLTNLTPKTYELKVTYVGYQALTVSVTITESDQSISRDLELTPTDRQVTVTATTERGTDANAQQSVRNAENVISAVSARAIEVSPDISVADASRRISGVTVTRSASGDAQYAVIRGMDKRYNYTTINGVKIPSPDNKNRYVPLDIFPSELLERLEVTKSLLPTMEGDAIGGAMNMVMKQAPDHLVATAQAGSGYDGLFLGRKFSTFDFRSAEQSPRVQNGLSYKATLSDFPLSAFNPRPVDPNVSQYFAATLGNRYFEDQSLGILVSGSYQHGARGANTIFFPTTVDQATNKPDLTDLEHRTYSTLQTRSGIAGNVDYHINSLNSLQLFGVYADLVSDELREVKDTELGLGWPNDLRVPIQQRSTHDEQAILNTTLGGDHSIFGTDLQANWKLVYSRATHNVPDRAQLDLYTGGTLQQDGSYKPDPVIVNDGSSRTWEYNLDEDKSAYLTLKSTEPIFGTETEFSYGGMYRAKTRSSLYDEYNLRAYNTNTIQRYSGDVTVDTFWIYDPYGTSNDPLNYDAHENVSAGFVQAKFQIGEIQTIGGVRVENTDFGWETQAPKTMAGRTGSITYMDILPSVSFKYSPTENQNWRLSYFRSISRPGFFEVIPNNGVEGDDYTETTNPYLNRTQASNVDARWEYFPSGLDQIIVGAFYKQIQDPIEYTVVEVKTKSYLEPQNFGDATNFGFEFDFRKYFSNFGVQANYTFTHSSITTDKSVKYRDANGNLTIRTEQQTRPLQGQSEHIGNLSLLYKDFENGTDAQIGLVYTGPAIVAVSPYLDNDVWQRAVFQLDLSGEQRLSGGLSLYLKVSNLLNSPREEVIHTPYAPPVAGTINYQTPGQDVLVRRELYDRTYVFGLRYKL